MKCQWFPALVPRSHFSWHSSHQDQIWSTLILHFTSKIVHPLQYYSTSRFYFSSKIISSIQILPWCPNFITLTPPQISPEHDEKNTPRDLLRIRCCPIIATEFSVPSYFCRLMLPPLSPLPSVIVWRPLVSPNNVAIRQSGPTFVVNIAELNQQTSQVWRHCVAHNIVIVA